MSETVTLKFDPRRPQVAGVMAAALEDQSEALMEQAIADAIMGALIIGEASNVDNAEQYINMIYAALPNARKAAASMAT